MSCLFYVPKVHSAPNSCLITLGHGNANLHVKASLRGAPDHQSFSRTCLSAPRICRSKATSARRAAKPVVMVMTESTPFQIGTTAPPFKLLEPLTGRDRTLDEISAGASATLVMFICNHCPFVKLLKEGIVSLARDYQPQGVAVVAISSNSIRTHPQDGPDQMAADAKQFGYSFPYLFDDTQEVAKAYRALCTPEFMIFDKKMELQYHGQFDSARPSSDIPVTGEDLRAALDDILAGKPVGKPIKPSVGCNIKWHP